MDISMLSFGQILLLVIWGVCGIVSVMSKGTDALLISVLATICYFAC
jgi:hypothetical protein